MVWITSIILGLIAGVLVQQEKDERERKSLVPIKIKSKKK